jgi:hypothetical protein
MKIPMVLATAAIINVALLSGDARAQGTPQTIELAKVDVKTLSIGGFLGMGSHLVVVPYDSLTFADKKMTLPGGSKEGLKMLPEFKYATE